MIPIEVLLAFLAASALITIAPGPDNLMVLSVGISRGRAASPSGSPLIHLGFATHRSFTSPRRAMQREAAVPLLSAQESRAPQRALRRAVQQQTENLVP